MKARVQLSDSYKERRISPKSQQKETFTKSQQKEKERSPKTENEEQKDRVVDLSSSNDVNLDDRNPNADEDTYTGIDFLID